MKWMSCLALATLALGVSVALAGDDVKSGFWKPGAPKTGPFTVTKYSRALTPTESRSVPNCAIAASTVLVRR